MNLRALIFDVDGTLADTEEAHRQSFNEAFRELGLGWAWDAALYAGLVRVAGIAERLAHYVETLDAAPGERARLHRLMPEVEAAKGRAYARLIAQGECPLRPGIRSLIDAARGAGVRLAIATATRRSNIDALVAAAFDAPAGAIFEVIASGDEVSAKKPAPDVYLLALRGLQLAPQQCVALEDSGNGLGAARAAGIATVICPTRWSAGDSFAGADLRVTSFEKASLAVLERLADWSEATP